MSYPRSEWCQACDRTTTHVRQGCTRCMGKVDDRKQGLLFAIIGGVILVFGLGWMSLGPLLARRNPTRRARFSGGWISIVMLVTGTALAGKGVRALVTGSDPEAEI